MRVECPGCGAAYEVAAAQVQPGRPVRCTRCDMQWRPMGPAREPPEVTLVRVASTALRGSAQRVHAPQPLAPIAPRAKAAGRLRRFDGWSMGWAASIVLLVGLLAAAGHWRGAIMHGWPPAIRLYSVLGAAAPERGATPPRV